LKPRRLSRPLRARSCLIDCEAIVCDANGLAVFDLLRRWSGDDVVLCAFDLLELDGGDRIKAPRFNVSVWSRRLLAEGQEPGCAGGHARGGGGLELKGTQVLGAVP
jgi:hypothetical protein